MRIFKPHLSLNLRAKIFEYSSFGFSFKEFRINIKNFSFLQNSLYSLFIDEAFNKLNFNAIKTKKNLYIFFIKTYFNNLFVKSVKANKTGNADIVK